MCDNAPKIAYGSVKSETAAMATYGCNTGYSMQGNGSIYCVGGVWIMDDYPLCLYARTPYTNDSMILNTTAAYTIAEQEPFPFWFGYGMMGVVGCFVLALFTMCLLSCCHLCGCCPGPVLAFGGRYQYSDRRWYSLLKWCDFMVQGKVCRKIRRSNARKVGVPPDEEAAEGEGEEAEDADEANEVDINKENGDDKEATKSGDTSESPPTSPEPDDDPSAPLVPKQTKSEEKSKTESIQPLLDKNGDSTIINIEDNQDPKTTDPKPKPQKTKNKRNTKTTK